MSNIEDFEAKLNKANEKYINYSTHKKQKEEDKENKRVGMQAGTELVTSFIAGGLLGYGLDQWLGTSPWFLISLMLLGMVIGFYNIYRLMNNLGSAVGYAQQHRELHQKQKKAKTSPDKENNNIEIKTD